MAKKRTARKASSTKKGACTEAKEGGISLMVRPDKLPEHIYVLRGGTRTKVNVNPIPKEFFEVDDSNFGTCGHKNIHLGGSSVAVKEHLRFRHIDFEKLAQNLKEKNDARIAEAEEKLRAERDKGNYWTIRKPKLWLRLEKTVVYSKIRRLFRR